MEISKAADTHVCKGSGLCSRSVVSILGPGDGAEKTCGSVIENLPSTVAASHRTILFLLSIRAMSRVMFDRRTAAQMELHASYAKHSEMVKVGRFDPSFKTALEAIADVHSMLDTIRRWSEPQIVHNACTPTRLWFVPHQN